MATDMTQGNPLKLILRFALPLALTSMLQSVYTLFDGIIVGQLLGAEAFAAVGSASILHVFLLDMLLGFSHGAGVLLAHRFGAKDQQGFRRGFAMSGCIGVAIGITLATLALLLMKPLLLLMNTPEELLAQTMSYLRILWLGLPLSALYNVCAAALRATGDSRTPLMALLLSSALNIALDYLLIGVVGLGVAGAALATVIAQGVSLLVCLSKIRASSYMPRVRADWKPHAKTVKELLRLGLPPLLSQGSAAVGQVCMQAAINGYGVVFIAGMAASGRYLSLLIILGGALEGGLAVFAGQNTGAEQAGRILQATGTTVRLGLALAAATAVAVLALAGPMIRLFIPDADPGMVRIGMDALRVEALFLTALYPLLLYRAVILGSGNAIIPMLSGFLELGLRLLCVWVMPTLVGREGLYFTNGITWIGAALLLIVGFYPIRKRLRSLSAHSAL